jgi:serine protease
MSKMIARRSMVVRVTMIAACMAAAFPQIAAAGGTISQFDTPLRSSEQTDRLIVKYRSTLNISAQSASVSTQRAQVMQAVGARMGLTMQPLRQTALGSQVLKLDRKVSPADAAALIADLKAADPNVEYAEPDRMMHALLTPNDSRYGEQWDLFEATGGMRVPGAWDQGNGSGVVVAVIDTGYRPHADLAGNLVAGYDFITDTTIANDGNGRDSDASDPGDWTNANECESGWPGSNSSWHGTHVAGTIAALTNNGSGVAGIAYGAKVQPLRVLGRCGGYTSDIADAIIWASGGSVSGVPANATPARVINMSLGGGGACDTTTQNAINSARSRGTVVVVAAGNENQNASNSNPANCQGVIAVAATGRYGARASYSNYGNVVTLAAPGGDMNSGAANGILSTLNAGTRGPGADSYAFYQGTSMATPHVAGVAALVIAKNPTLTPDQVKNTLTSTVRAFPGTCSGCGAGLVDASAAVAAAAGGGGGGGSGNVAETEPNNTRTASMLLSKPTTVAGAMASSSDQDWFRVDLPAGKKLTVTLAPASGTADYDLYVYNASGTQIGKSELGAGKTDTVSVTNTGASTSARYVQVRYYSGGTGATNGKYTLTTSW